MRLLFLLFSMLVLINTASFCQDDEIQQALDTINTILKSSSIKMTFDGTEYISVENTDDIKNYRTDEYSFSLKQIEEVIYEEEQNYHVLKFICLLAEKPCFSNSDSTNGVRYLPLLPNPNNERIAIELMFIKTRM